MRPVIRIVLLGLLVTAVVGLPASAASRWWSPSARSIHAHAAAGSARQGGTLVVAVEVRVPRRLVRRGVTPTAGAVVHFASGDVSVDLSGRYRGLRGHRFGGHRWWASSRVWRGVARVPVSATEKVGRVRVHVTVAVGDGSVTVVTFGRIRKGRGNPAPQPEPEDPCPSGCTVG